MDGGDLRFLSSQPESSLHCETTDRGLMYRAVYYPYFAGTHCSYPRRDGQAELTWVAGYIPRWFTLPQTVTNPSINRAQCRVTSLIETNALPLSQTATYRNWTIFIYATEFVRDSCVCMLYCTENFCAYWWITVCYSHHDSQLFIWSMLIGGIVR